MLLAQRVGASRIGYWRNEEDAQNLGEVYADADLSKSLNFGYKGLVAVPKVVFEMKHVRRLELNNNFLQVLSPAIGDMTLLEELWLNDNPLRLLPGRICKCEGLKVLDLSRTQITELPLELGRLNNTLHELELTDTPYIASSSPLNTKRLLTELWRLDESQRLRNEIIDKVNNGIYREFTDEYSERINDIIDAVTYEFQENMDELRNVCRNADRLFPLDIIKHKYKHISPKTIAKNIRASFTSLKKANARKILSAEFELKLRAFYYDRIDVTRIESYIHDIFTINNTVVSNQNDTKPLELEDIQFLIQHAARLLPAEASLIKGSKIRNNVWQLQQKLDYDRATHIKAVSDAVFRIYPDVEPNNISFLVHAVCETFQSHRYATKLELDHLKILAADASLLFPSEFSRAKPEKIRAKFFKQLVNDDAAGGNTSPLTTPPTTT
uniref:Uncharacterized protein n=1 Tax=Aureoumbra lagunensis TaxID=44058 RepID=A0A7S3NQW4_9STRA|mmetsp:Transcript_21096/g.32354  ORF Transcript_21096/g.32354 Transcript_21096/m.32354 type:complete len:440 (+) Transcript_21096:28-1347(+)